MKKRFMYYLLVMRNKSEVTTFQILEFNSKINYFNSNVLDFIFSLVKLNKRKKE